MEDKRFDDIIKNKLSEFRMDDATSNWELMEEKLFDDSVHSKLVGHEMAGATPRWDLFQEKQKQIQAKHEDRAFDNVVRKSIGKHKVPYNSGHWIQLKDRLEKIYARRQGLYTLKSLEVLLLFVILINFAGNIDRFVDNTPTYFANEISTSENISNQEIHNTTIQPEAETVSISEAHQTSAGIENIEPNQKATSTYSTDSDNKKRNALKVDNDNLVQENTPSTVSNVVKNSETALVSELSTDLQSSQNTVAEISKEASQQSSTTAVESLPLSIAENVGIAGLTLRDLTLDWSVRKPALSLSAFVNEKEKEIVPIVNNGGWLHAVISFDNNSTATPFDEAYPASSAFTKESVGFSAAVLYSRSINKFEIESGLAYSKYNSDSDFYDIYKSGVYNYIHRLNAIQYEIVSTPVKLKYHLMQRTDFSLFASAGISPELILASQYDTKKDFHGLPPIGGPIGPTAPDETFSNIQRFGNFTDGVLHEGKFSNSFFVRANFGLGIQKNISSNVSAYISGDYFFNVINQVGPTNDNINKYSLSFGLKRKI